MRSLQLTWNNSSIASAFAWETAWKETNRTNNAPQQRLTALFDVTLPGGNKSVCTGIDQIITKKSRKTKSKRPSRLKTGIPEFREWPETYHMNLAALHRTNMRSRLG